MKEIRNTLFSVMEIIWLSLRNLLAFIVHMFIESVSQLGRVKNYS